jgi:surface polysaccharide O-acyltransferase-like enzyme
MESNNKKTERVIYLDYIRLFAIILVVGIRSPLPVDDANGMVYSFVTVLCTPCNALFFMVSGALLLPMKNDSWKSFLSRRLSKVIFPVIVWSAITLCIEYLDDVKTLPEIGRDFCMLPFFPHANYNYWFVYVLVGLYLLTPILSPWLKTSNQKDVQYFLFLWMISLVFMLVACFGIKMPKPLNGTLYYFGGWVGCYVLGYYLNTYSVKKGLKRWLLFIILPFIVYVGLKYQNIEYDYQEVMGYITIFTALSALSWFVLLKQVKWQSRNWIEKMSSLSFGVYLCHTIIRDCVVCKIPFIYSYGSIALVASVWIFTLAFSFIMVYCLSKVPYASYIIGYSDKR